MKKAREEADALSDEWRSSVEHEKESFLHNIKESLAHQAVLISQKSLHDLADASLEQQMTKMFIGKLAEIEDDEKSAMKQAIHENEKRAAVKTSFDLPEEERGRIKKEFQERLGIEASIDFEKTGDILAGIELTAGGRKIGWTIAEYIEDASEAIAQALGQERGEQPSSGDHNQEQGQGPEQKRQKDEGESTEEGTDRDA
jgi:F-type H+-transporting ATPase subunit b